LVLVGAAEVTLELALQVLLMVAGRVALEGVVAVALTTQEQAVLAVMVLFFCTTKG
jgi:hypothetical protein